MSTDTQTPDPVPNTVPVTIHLKNGKRFVVTDINAWGYVDEGVFATGQFHGYSGETDVLIPYDSVDYYELDFPRLKKFIAQQQQESNESPSP